MEIQQPIEDLQTSNLDEVMLVNFKTAKFGEKSKPHEKWLKREALKFVERFQSMNERSKLIICPTNEFKKKKIITSFLVPICTQYRELNYLQSCSQFVSGYLRFNTLSPIDSFPEYFATLPTTSAARAGNCFEFSQLLVSLLLGAGYDAYCVCGKAPLNLFISKVRDDYEASSDESIPKALTGSSDVRYLHCWVLVRRGKRNVTQDVFVEPSTGVLYSCDEYPCTSIYFIWNSGNYWGRIQDEQIDCDWSFIELENTNVFTAFKTDHSKQHTQEKSRRATMLKEKSYEFSSSWFTKPNVSVDAFRNRYINGYQALHSSSKATQKFSYYTQVDGLTERTTQQDEHNIHQVVEHFKNRRDLLFERMKCSDYKCIETFEFGRNDLLFQHILEGNIRRLTFYPYRMDGLLSYYEMVGSKIKECYGGRSDGLVYEAISYHEITNSSKENAGNIEILKITQRFESLQQRDESNANIIQKKVFHISKGLIEIIFSHSAGHILAPSLLFKVRGAHLIPLINEDSKKRNKSDINLSFSELHKLLNDQAILLVNSKKRIHEGPRQIFNRRIEEENLVVRAIAETDEIDKQKLTQEVQLLKQEELWPSWNVEDSVAEVDVPLPHISPLIERHCLPYKDAAPFTAEVSASIIRSIVLEMRNRVLQKWALMRMELSVLLDNTKEETEGPPNRRNTFVGLNSEELRLSNIFQSKVLRHKIMQSEMEVIRRFAEVYSLLRNDERFAKYFETN